MKIFRWLSNRFHAWRIRRRQRHVDIVIATQARQIEELQSTVALREREIQQLIGIVTRDRERVAWETARFSRGIEEARNSPGR